MSCGHTATKEPFASSPGTNFASAMHKQSMHRQDTNGISHRLRIAPARSVHTRYGRCLNSIEASKLDQMHAGIGVSPRRWKQ
jgi:hypothetical protein